MTECGTKVLLSTSSTKKPKHCPIEIVRTEQPSKMLIGICGGMRQLKSHRKINANSLQIGIAAGKSSIASYLVQEHNFTRIHLNRASPPPSVERTASNSQIPQDKAPEIGTIPSFHNAEALLDFVTAKWQDRWVTTDVWDEGVLEVFLRRPFFLLVSVDSPVSLRWERFKARYFPKSLKRYLN